MTKITINFHDDGGEHWITLEPSGSHVLLNSSGEVKGGAGGKLNGKKLGPGTHHVSKNMGDPDEGMAVYHEPEKTHRIPSETELNSKKHSNNEEFSSYTLGGAGFNSEHKSATYNGQVKQGDPSRESPGRYGQLYGAKPMENLDPEKIKKAKEEADRISKLIGKR